MSNTPQYILNFMNAVYDNNGDLALSSFNEKIIIDATNKINELKEEIKKCNKLPQYFLKFMYMVLNDYYKISIDSENDETILQYTIDLINELMTESKINIDVIEYFFSLRFNKQLHDIKYSPEIKDFFNAIYGNIAASNVNITSSIIDATNKINELKEEIKKCKNNS